MNILHYRSLKLNSSILTTKLHNCSSKYGVITIRWPMSTYTYRMYLKTLVPN